MDEADIASTGVPNLPDMEAFVTEIATLRSVTKEERLRVLSALRTSHDGKERVDALGVAWGAFIVVPAISIVVTNKARRRIRKDQVWKHLLSITHRVEKVDPSLLKVKTAFTTNWVRISLRIL